MKELKDKALAGVIRGSHRGLSARTPVVKYLKRFSDLRDTEPSIYRFAEGTPEFPAPGSAELLIDEEVWLVLDRASGTLLADVCGEGLSRAYLDAARGLAEYHSRAALLRWTDEFKDLLVTPESVESLPESVLGDLFRKVDTGEFSGVDRSLLRDAARAVEKSWPEIAGSSTDLPSHWSMETATTATFSFLQAEASVS